MFTSSIVQRVCKLSCIVLVLLPIAYGDEGTVVKNNTVNVDPYKFIGTTSRQYSGRQLFNFRKNGIRVDIRVVPTERNNSVKDEDKDGFPEFPTKDIGLCIINFSLVCAKKRFSGFVESIKELKEIYLMGQGVKLVKTRIINDGKSSNNTSIERSIDDLFDIFALRITLPRWNGKREKNQIDVMLDETAVSEGRGKKGGGGGGGKGGGGKCKMMMMAGLMMLKMKVMGIATMKGMMMAGMSLMMSMVMLMQKWKGGGGGGHGGGGGQYKEIVLLTKSSGGGGSSDSYGAPPPSSYGVPSGGGGYGGGGGGGWGRSFERRFITSDYDKDYTTDTINLSPTVEKSITNVNYQNYNAPTGPNVTPTKWNLSHADAIQRYQYLNNNGSVKNDSNMEPLLYAESTNYAVETDPYQNVNSRDYTIDSVSNTYVDNVNSVGSTNYVANNYDTNVVRPIYADEWEATDEKILPAILKRREALKSK